MTYKEEDPEFLEHIKEAWPNVENEDEYPDILMSITCFPFGKARKVISQLKEIHELSGGDLHKAMDIVDSRMRKAHNEFKKNYPQE